MSYSLSVTAPRDEFEEKLAEARASPEPEPGTDAANAVKLAKGLASDAVSTGIVGGELICLSISGHSTDGNAPHPAQDGVSAQVPSLSINLHGRPLPEPVEEPEAEADADGAAEPDADAVEPEEPAAA